MTISHPEYLPLRDAIAEYGADVLTPLLASGAVRAKFRRHGKFTSATSARIFLDDPGDVLSSGKTPQGWEIFIWRLEVTAALTRTPERPKPKLLVDNVVRLADGRRKPGPKPSVTARVKAEMEKFDLETLNEMGEDAMAAQFRASRDTCRKARKELLNSDR